MYRLIDVDPQPHEVYRLTFVPFLPTGECVAIADGPQLPAGDVAAGEDYLLDASLRVPLLTAAFRRQLVAPFAILDEPDGPGQPGLHVATWIEGHAPYRGRRPHAEVELLIDTAETVADRMERGGRVRDAHLVRDGARRYRNQTEESYYANNLRILEPSYLRADTPQGGSGWDVDPDQWRAGRQMVADAIDGDGTFLDLGCANGLLMESVRDWAAERGHTIEPYGIDLGPELVALAHRRLPHWADRIEVGNAIDYEPADGRRFTYVHALLGCVPHQRRPDLMRHVFGNLVEPGGRMIVSEYGAEPGRTARDYVTNVGFPVAGASGEIVWVAKDANTG